jgi:hypothetical protein
LFGCDFDCSGYSCFLFGLIFIVKVFGKPLEFCVDQGFAHYIFLTVFGDELWGDLFAFFIVKMHILTAKTNIVYLIRLEK